MIAGEVTAMPFICDPEYMEALKRLGEKIPGAACAYETGDSELLAKLYEKNMKAQAKKSAGAFYTPPKIVQFMCRESLSHYISNCTGLSYEKATAFINQSSTCTIDDLLHDGMHNSAAGIDSALANIKIFDPSVGCGAFALGMLDEIARLREIITPYISQEERLCSKAGNRTTAHLLQDAVRNNIFAADTDPIAVEITSLRLRQRLSSAISHEMEGSAQTGKTPLQCCENAMPGFGSFEHNVKCADSLLEYDVGGFDIVIGNPPYISAVEGARDGKGTRQALREKFLLLTGAFDIYTAFLLDGIRKTKENGVFCWIIPNKFLVSQYAAPVLEHLKQNGLRQSISVSDLEVFSRVGVYPIIIIGNRCSLLNFAEYRADNLSDLSSRTFYLKTELRTYDTFADHNIKMAAGAAGFQARSLSQHICENQDDAADKDGAIPFVVSGCIGRYSIKYENVRYMGATYDKAYISKGKGIAESKWRLWLRDKICIAGLTREIRAYYSRRPLALGVGTYAIYEFGDFDPLFLLGVLNSSFMSHYVSEKFHERHLSGKYLAINKSMLEQLPIVKADMETQALISRNAARLLELPSDSPEAEQLARHIDEVVRRMYGESEV